MENNSSVPGSPAGGPLNALTPDRMNQQRPQSALLSSVRTELRDSAVHEKISQFNTLALHGKQLERKTADAALSRAILGREEAESEMRRYRDEARALRKLVEDGRDRERKVGERLEHVMEQYGRAKEMHAHTQALWEKEIRRQRKEYYKAHSSGVKHAEELKMTKTNLTIAEESLAMEKERSRAREQEAFAARYQIVGVQEQLEQACEKIKLLEQERDAFKTLAKNEEVARIAAEGCLPLPPADKEDDEFASPKKKRVSLTTVDIVSSAASEEEIEELSRRVRWETQRADRAQEHVEFLLAECELRCCACAKAGRRGSIISPRRQRPGPIEIADPGDLAILSERPQTTPEEPTSATSTRNDDDKFVKPARPNESRRSTIFCPREGIFRTVSQQEAEALEGVEEDSPTEPPTPVDQKHNPRIYARTPSVDPPAFALLAQERTSLLSLLNAPHQESYEHDNADLPVIPTIPTMPDVPDVPEAENVADDVQTPEGQTEPQLRPHTSAAFYTVTKTTTVPLRGDDPDRLAELEANVRSQLNSSQSSFNASDPAMTPKISREQALAQIRERRGRARSAAQGAATPRRQMVQGVERRDLSAPTARPAGKMRS